MHSFRKWFYKPKKEDASKLAQFYWADEELSMIAQELDSFDGRTDPDRCSLLVNQLRSCQDKVLTICNEIMDEAIPKTRANRDFRVKFPDDVLHENIVGQLWFGAECLAAGSNILNREVESAGMRPLAKALTRALDSVRCLLREQSLKNQTEYGEKVKESLKIFDKLFAEFELSYVSAMVPVKSSKEHHLQQEIVVLFSETLQRAVKMKLFSQRRIDEYDPALMFAIPRLSIVWGLLIYNEGPLNLDLNPKHMSDLFRPFHSLLYKIRDLIWTLSRPELQLLEKMLCSLDDPLALLSEAYNQDEINEISNTAPSIQNDEDFMNKFYQNHRNCKQFVKEFYSFNFGTEEPKEFELEEELEGGRLYYPTDENVAFNITSLRSSSPPVIEMSIEDSEQLLSSLPTMTECSDDDDSCTCDAIACFSEEVAVSRTVLSHVMQRVEIVPPSNLPQPPLVECPQSYHLSMLSQSLPVNSPLHLRPHKSESDSKRSKTDYSEPLRIPRIRTLRAEGHHNGSFSAGESVGSIEGSSPETISYTSECQEDEEIALALQAAEIASCREARARFKNGQDLIHKLFVCISGVADQLQTNYASDLRNILKCVFDINCTVDPPEDLNFKKIELSLAAVAAPSSQAVDEEVSSQEDKTSIDSAEEVLPDSQTEEPPIWIPDSHSDHCMSCCVLFTLIRRRHHCRNCGRLVCSQCSSHCSILPRFGHLKPVRVCDECFEYRLTSFTVQPSC